jgi:hypothetical protein
MAKQFAIDVDFRVTKRIYVDADTAEQAEQIIKEKLDNNPYQYCTSPDACSGYDIYEVNECEEEEKSEFDKALDYVREQMDDDDMAILQAEMNKCYKMHLVPSGDVVDCSKVIDLLEEYGEDNDLPEGWWENEGDIDDILLKL